MCKEGTYLWVILCTILPRTEDWIKKINENTKKSSLFSCNDMKKYIYWIWKYSALQNEKEIKTKQETYILSTKEPGFLCLNAFDISDLWLSNSYRLLLEGMPTFSSERRRQISITSLLFSVFFFFYYFAFSYTIHSLVLFGLVSLFNGISTLFRLFNAKAILLEKQ